MTDRVTRLFDLRRLSGLTQAQVAEAMGVSEATVSGIEAKYPDVRFSQLRTYLDALGVDVHFVIDDRLDILSGDIEQDTSRTYIQSRYNDPTRGVPKRRG